MGATHQYKICFENLIGYIKRGGLKLMIAKIFSLSKNKHAQEMFKEQ